jgi:hypothetical protein
MTSQEAQKEALEFSNLNKNELNVRNSLEKYWLKKASDINDTDTKQLAQLRRNFENTNFDDSYTPDKLKNINMFLNLDWIQNDPNLQKDFEKYLKILKENNFQQMVLVGGLNAIDLTARWSRYSDADKLMQKWIENTVTMLNPSDILSFSDTQTIEKKY